MEGLRLSRVPAAIAAVSLVGIALIRMEGLRPWIGMVAEQVKRVNVGIALIRMEELRPFVTRHASRDLQAGPGRNCPDPYGGIETFLPTEDPGSPRKTVGTALICMEGLRPHGCLLSLSQRNTFVGTALICMEGLRRRRGS